VINTFNNAIKLLHTIALMLLWHLYTILVADFAAAHNCFIFALKKDFFHLYRNIEGEMDKKLRITYLEILPPCWAQIDNILAGEEQIHDSAIVKHT